MHLAKGVTSALLVASATMWSAASAEGVTFTATLSSIRITATPGQVVTRHFELTLGADEPPTVFDAAVQDWWRSVDGNQTFYAPAGRVARSCSPWVTLNPVEAAVAGGATLHVRVSVAVPQEVASGGHWCALTLNEIPDPAAATEGIQMQFLASLSVGIYVYIEPVERVITIEDVEMSGDTARIHVRVDGNTPVAIEGRLEFLTGDRNVTAAVLPLPRTTILIEPARVGIIAAALPDTRTLPSGRYLVRVLLDIGLDHYIGVESTIELKRAADGRP